MKCIPVERGGDRREVGRVLERFSCLLSRGDVGLIFPEGGRSRSGRVDVDASTYGVGRVVKALPGCRVLCVYLRGEGQTTYTDAPARGERFRVRFASLEPKTEHGGMRGSLAITQADAGAPRGPREGLVRCSAMTSSIWATRRPAGARATLASTRACSRREERAALAAAPDPERLRWCLWAAKEAAYKCLKKLAPETCFLARCASRCGSGADGTGTVEAGGRRLRVALFREGDALHAVATDAARPAASACCARWRSCRPKPARRTAPPRRCARWPARRPPPSSAARPDELAIVREGRRPRLRRRGGLPTLDLSLSHHGRFLAAALERTPEAGAS